MFHRGNPPCFFAFDLLSYGKDLRTERLLDRKQELRRLLAKDSPPFPLRYADHVEGSGTALFQRVCKLDLEGIVAKQKFGPYVVERESSTWYKILNGEYSQKDGREELFERERHSEAVAGWHLCDFRRSVSDRDNGGSGGESGGYCGTSTISAFNHVTLMNRHCSPLYNARDPLCRRPH